MGSPAEAVLNPFRRAVGRSGLDEFLKWWWSELVALTPVRWRERFSSRRIAFVAIEPERWRFFQRAEGGLVEIGQAMAASLEGPEGRAAFHRLALDAVGGGGNLWLLLPRDGVLIREARMPIAAEEALREAVGFELDRLTPLAQENALFDCRIIRRDAAAQALHFQLAAAARLPIERLVRQLRELGAIVLGVGVEGDVDAATAPFNLLPEDMRDQPATSGSVLVARILAGVAGLLAVAALAFPLWQKREAVIELFPRLEKAKAGADVAERLAREIETLADEHNFVVSRKQGQFPTVVLLEDLSRLLPDTTWLQQLDIKAGPKVREVQIAGESGSSSQLVEVLEKSGSLVNVSFKSPLTKGVTPGTERFLLAAEVKPRPLPNPIPEDSLTAEAEKARGALPQSATPVNASPASQTAAPPSTAAAGAPAGSVQQPAVVEPKTGTLPKPTPAVPASPPATVEPKPGAPAPPPSVPAKPAARS